MKRLCVLLVVMGFVDWIHASCFVAPLVNKKTLLGPKPLCELKHKSGVMLRFEIGSSFTMDCNQCKCSKDGLHCCGTGYYAGLMAGPEGCIFVPNGRYGCEPILIKDGETRKKNYRYCESGELVRKSKNPYLP